MAFTNLEIIHIRIFRRIDALRHAGERGHPISSLNAPSVVDRLMDPANQILTAEEVDFLRQQVAGVVSRLFDGGPGPKITKPLQDALVAAMRRRVSRYALYPKEHRSHAVPRDFGALEELPYSETVARCLALAARLCVERAVILAAFEQAGAELVPG